MKVFTAFILALLAVTLLHPGHASAAALQIRPLMYRETLQADQTKKGFVDVSNASSTSVTVEMNVRAFRQVDGQGDLKFYDSPAVTRGVQLDLKELDLGPGEAVRMYFQVDAKQLPKGDVFAAIFAATKSQQSGGIAPSAQVGTLLILQNGQAGPRTIDVQSVDVAPLQFGSAISGSVKLRNPAPSEPASGFNPEVTVTLTPFAELRKQVNGPLVMSGISRSVDFNLPASRIGIYRLTATAGRSSKQTWLIAVTGFWRWLLPAVAVAAVACWYATRWLRRRRRVAPVPEQSRSDPAVLPEEPISAPTSVEGVPTGPTEDAQPPGAPELATVPSSEPEESAGAEVPSVAVEPQVPETLTQAAPKKQSVPKKSSEKKSVNATKTKQTKKKTAKKSSSKTVAVKRSAGKKPAARKPASKKKATSTKKSDNSHKKA
jgi:hypothetical protein